jgi:hypothetical protein
VTLAVDVAGVGQGLGNPGGTVTFKDGNTVLGAPVTLDAHDHASLSLSTLSVGTHNITASYSGDASFASSSSTVWAQEVDAAHSTTALTSSATSAVVGQPVTFTATVTDQTAGAGTPSGTVTFKDGTTPLGSPATVDASGHASLSISTLSVGTHNITAVYSGDSHIATSTSTSLSEQINKAASTTTLTSSAKQAVVGQQITLTATVAGSGQGLGKPGGTVTFKDGTTALGAPVTLDAAGKATLSLSTLALGSHSITAVYSGDSNFAVSTSQTLAEKINQADTTIALASSASTGVAGQPVTFTTTVTPAAPGAGKPTGKVIFKNGSVILGGPVTLDANGKATFTTTYQTQGVYNIGATYQGDTNFASSTSVNLVQKVGGAPSTTTLTSSATTAMVGQQVTFTASVAAARQDSGKPAGWVTFKEDDIALKTVQLDAQGKATYAVSFGSPGNNNITAVYSGDDHFASSKSQAMTEQVKKAGTTITLTSAESTSVAGEAAIFTATVTPVAPGAGRPTGSVSFKQGNTDLGSVPVNANGRVNFAITFPDQGNFTITAVYHGDADFTSSASATLNQQVNPAASTTTLTSSATPALVGQSTTFTATVAGQGSDSPDGWVAFKEGNIVLKTVHLNGNDQATYTTTFGSPGSNDITAVYSGDNTFAGSKSQTLTEQVNKASSAVALTSSASFVEAGHPVTITAAVTAAAPGAGKPTGTVTFMDGNTPLGSAIPLNVGGIATLSSSTLSVGTHNITAVYSGDADFTTSTSTVLVQGVTAGSLTPSTTTLTSSAATATAGQPITLTATVAGQGSNKPGGTVTFKDGNTALGSPVTLDATGKATLSLSTLGVGGHSITAVYTGDSHFAGSTSTALSEQINSAGPAGSTTTLTTSAATVATGQQVTFTAVVAGSGQGLGKPGGTVTFKDGNNILGAPVTLDATGKATYSTTALTIGGHTITAVYSGDVHFATSTSAGVIENVNPVGAVASTTTLATSSTTVFAGQGVTFTATVAGSVQGSGKPTGQVTFKDGSTVLKTVAVDATGHATYSTSGLSVGGHSITATYSGDNHFVTSTSTAVAEQVNKAGSHISLFSSAISVTLGSQVTFTITVTVPAPGSGIPTGTVTLKDGSTVLGTPITLDANGQATFVTSTLAVGSHGITASYSGDVNIVGSTTAPLTEQVTLPTLGG